jgi:hypothetical protein
MLSPLGGYGKPAAPTEKPAICLLKELLHAQQARQHPGDFALALAILSAVAVAAALRVTMLMPAEYLSVKRVI